MFVISTDRKLRERELLNSNDLRLPVIILLFCGRLVSINLQPYTWLKVDYVFLYAFIFVLYIQLGWQKSSSTRARLGKSSSRVLLGLGLSYTEPRLGSSLVFLARLYSALFGPKKARSKKVRTESKLFYLIYSTYKPYKF